MQEKDEKSSPFNVEETHIKPLFNEDYMYGQPEIFPGLAS